MVDQGRSVPIVAELAGRSPREVVLYTRPEGQTDAPWRATAMTTADQAPASKRRVKLEKVEAPLVYRVVAGPATSPTYRIDVRYPLALKAFDVDLTPPAYTGIRPSTVKGGDLRVIERTEVMFRIAFDAPPADASLVLTEPSAGSKKNKKAPAPQVIPLKAEGTSYSAGLKLSKGLVYRIEASTRDGRVLPENRYKIEVIEDRAPRVAFEAPDEALEVHPIAEVLHRVRVADDFGLTRAGVVYRFGGGDEQTLVLQDFVKQPAKSRTSRAAQEDAAAGEARRLADRQPRLLRFCRGQRPSRGQADRDRPPVPRHPPLQARVQGGRRRGRGRPASPPRPWPSSSRASGST